MRFQDFLLYKELFWGKEMRCLIWILINDFMTMGALTKGSCVNAVTTTAT